MHDFHSCEADAPYGAASFAGVDFSSPRCRPPPAEVCACRLSQADPHLLSTQHLLNLRMRYVNSVGALSGLASRRHPCGTVSRRRRWTANLNAPLSTSCAALLRRRGPRHVHSACDPCSLRICSRLLPCLRESAFSTSALRAEPHSAYTCRLPDARFSSRHHTSPPIRSGVVTLLQETVVLSSVKFNLHPVNRLRRRHTRWQCTA